ARVGRRDFNVKKGGRARNLGMDFDLKRKPIRDSFYTVRPEVEGEAYEMANFDTEPYATVAEYEMFKEAGRWAANAGCLRTQADWDRYFAKVGTSTVGKRIHIEDLDWNILLSCVRGWRYHGPEWYIPYLDGNHSVDEKIAFVNAFNKSTRTFKRTDWDNACKKARENSILPLSACQDKLDEMRAAGDAMPSVK
ncbi:MAG: hypothetical protein Q3963_09305, partial [Coriobacteriaceae bacterium]|nr:hypothetical protein [Coriobacteriaceae bacterium]